MRLFRRSDEEGTSPEEAQVAPPPSERPLFAKLLILLAIAAYAVAFVLENRKQVDVHFVVKTATFIVVSLAATLGVFSKEQAADLANLSRWAFLLTFAGVGLSTDFREMRKQGLYPFIVGAAGEIGIAIVTLGIVIAVQPWLPV